MIEDSLTLRRAMGEKAGIALSLHFLGAVALALAEGDPASARALLEESLSLAQGVDDRAQVADALLVLGLVAIAEGRPEAREHLLGGRRLASGDVRSTNSFLIAMAAFAVQESSPRFAAQLLGAVQSALDPLGLAVEPETKFVHTQTHDKTRAALGEPGFKAAWDEGRLWSLAEAVERTPADRT